jgi:hypothetical protein
MRGSVRLEGDHPDGVLVPVLAFEQLHTGDLHFVDVEAQGEFPADFELRVYQPPPEGAVGAIWPRFPEEDYVAFGYISAVTEDHPERLRLGVQIYDETELHDDGSLIATESWCTSDDSECYVEVRTCPPGVPLGQCPLETSGDPALAEEATDKLAGLSQNYRVLYLAAPAPAGSFVAHLVGAEDGLPAGYHLLSETPTDKDDFELIACSEEADQLALDRYTEAHPGTYTVDELVGSGDSEYLRLDAIANADLECHLGTLRVAADPASAPIEVRIGERTDVGTDGVADDSPAP